jgi:hypothetical protein
MICRHDRHTPQGLERVVGLVGDFWEWLQLSAMATIEAVFRLPTPASPVNNKAWGKVPLRRKVCKSRTASRCPMMESKPGTITCSANRTDTHGTDVGSDHRSASISIANIDVALIVDTLFELFAGFEKR